MESIRQRTRERQIYGLQISSHQDIRFKASKFKGAKVANITSHCLADRSRLVLAFWDSQRRQLPSLSSTAGAGDGNRIHPRQPIDFPNESPGRVIQK